MDSHRRKYHRYDYNTHQFVHYNIVDSTGTYNTNWAYYLFEDTDGKLWIATCLGGIFVVDKHKLIQSAGRSYVADQNYSIHNGLSGMLINRLSLMRKVMYGYCYTTAKE